MKCLHVGNEQREDIADMQVDDSEDPTSEWVEMNQPGFYGFYRLIKHPANTGFGYADKIAPSSESADLLRMKKIMQQKSGVKVYQPHALACTHCTSHRLQSHAFVEVAARCCDLRVSVWMPLLVAPPVKFA